MTKYGPPHGRGRKKSEGYTGLCEPAGVPGTHTVWGLSAISLARVKHETLSIPRSASPATWTCSKPRVSGRNAGIARNTPPGTADQRAGAFRKEGKTAGKVPLLQEQG